MLFLAPTISTAVLNFQHLNEVIFCIRRTISPIMKHSGCPVLFSLSNEEIAVTSILAFLVSGGGVMCAVWSSYKTTEGIVKTSAIFPSELRVLGIALLTGG